MFLGILWGHSHYEFVMCTVMNINTVKCLKAEDEPKLTIFPWNMQDCIRKLRILV